MLKSHEEDDVDGERWEAEEMGRAEEELLHFGIGGGDDEEESVGAGSSISALVTNPLPLDTPPTTSSTQGSLELTNTGSELTPLGKNHWSMLCGAA